MKKAKKKLNSIKNVIQKFVLTDNIPLQSRHVLETQMERIDEILNKKWKN